MPRENRKFVTESLWPTVLFFKRDLLFISKSCDTMNWRRWIWPLITFCSLAMLGEASLRINPLDYCEAGLFFFKVHKWSVLALVSVALAAGSWWLYSSPCKTKPSIFCSWCLIPLKQQRMHKGKLLYLFFLLLSEAYLIEQGVQASLFGAVCLPVTSYLGSVSCSRSCLEWPPRSPRGRQLAERAVDGWSSSIRAFSEPVWSALSCSVGFCHNAAWQRDGDCWNSSLAWCRLLLG